MADPSPLDITEQIKQVQQNNWAQTMPQQLPLHPMATGGTYVSPPPLPIQSANTQSQTKPKGTGVSMSKLSLLGITFSLMALGAMTFLGGFLLGIWFVGPQQTSVSVGYGMGESLQQSPVLQQNTGRIPPQNGGRQALGEQLGYATQMDISNAPIPNVPTFLAPLITATRSAVGQQAGYKIQQQISQRSNTSPQPAAPSSLPATMPATPPLSPSSPSTEDLSSLPVLTPQHTPPASPRTDATPLSSGGKNENYTVQLGVYASKDNASALVSHLQALNLTSHILQSKDPDGSYSYYVHSGHYKDYPTALEAASQFSEYNIPGAIIVKVSKNNERTL